MISETISASSFFEENFERYPALFKSCYTGKFFDWHDLDESIYSSQSSPLGVRIHNGVDFIDPAGYSKRCIEVGVIKIQLNKDFVEMHLAAGSTLVFNRIESVSIKIRNICNELSDFIGEVVIANGYAAFGNSGSFGDHWDTHDVFAIQLMGRKRWLLYSPTFTLPLPGQTSKNYKHCRPAEPVLDVVLEPGDVLYVPRGWWHSATPLGEPTFHIAAGVHTIKLIDYIKWISENSLMDREEMRSSVRSNALSSPVTGELLSVLASEMRSEENWTRFMRSVSGEKLSASGIDISGFVGRWHSRRT